MTAPISLSRQKAAQNPNARWEALNDFLAFADTVPLTGAPRTAYLAYNYSSLIEMAGHGDYFSSTSQWDHSEVVAALRAIGANEQASVLTTALSAMRAAGERAPQNYSNRFLAGVEFADLLGFDDEFGQCTRSVPDCLKDYLDRHEAEFIEWKV